MPLSSSSRHPCFSGCAKGRYGRVHLPVAPVCNIKCSYCNRRHDCVNESRPGVTSRLLKPEEAVQYLRHALKKEPRISVVGIAGPGDPFATPERTLETLRLVRNDYPEPDSLPFFQRFERCALHRRSGGVGGELYDYHR